MIERGRGERENNIKKLLFANRERKEPMKIK